MPDVTLIKKSDIPPREPVYNTTDEPVDDPAEECPLKKALENLLEPVPRVVRSYFMNLEGDEIQEITKETMVNFAVETEHMAGEEVYIELPSNAGDFEYKGELINNESLLKLKIGGDFEVFILHVISKPIDVPASRVSKVKRAPKVPKTKSPPPPKCPSDIVIDAPCRIVKSDGGKIRITVKDLDGFSGGSFAWTSSSTKIKLQNPNSATVTIEGLNDISSGKDAEEIKVTRTQAGCSPVEKTVKITVAKVTFSVSAKQRYGFDDFDTPGNPADNHICIKKSDHSFVNVNIEGGAIGTDFNFVCASSAVCTPEAPPGTTQFDLRLNSGATNKGQTDLKVNTVNDTSTEFAKLKVHVYKQREVDVVVAKIDHPSNTYLRFDTANYANHGATANTKLKEAVVKYNITNFSPTNATTGVTFASGNGTLSYDINEADGGPDLRAIKSAMTGTGTKVRVAIINNLKSFYYTTSPIGVYNLKNGAAIYHLNAAVNIKDKEIEIREASVVFKVGDKVPLGTGAGLETIEITAVNGKKITCKELKKAHAAGSILGSKKITLVEASTIFKVGDKVPLGTGAGLETIEIDAVNGSIITCKSLTKAHASGTTLGTNTSFTVKGGSVFFKVGKSAPLGIGAKKEAVSFTNIVGNKITCTALNKTHAVGSPLEFPAAGWSTDPILIQEGTASLNFAKWTILHEVGHRGAGLALSDVNDQTNFMHFKQSWTDYRLRYCPRNLEYTPGGTENQWETIPRT